VERGERGAAGIDLVAVRSGQPLDALLLAHPVQQAARPAVGIGDEDPRVSPGSAPLADPLAHGARDPVRPVVEQRREHRDVDLGQAAGQRQQLARERAAADDQDAVRPRHDAC
jgi:hypothetical protein